MSKKAAPPMWEYCDVDDLSSAATRFFYNYWVSKVKGDTIPSRRDIDPVEFPQFMANCLILDVEGPGRYRYRLFGTHIADWNERDLTGHLLDRDVLGDAAPMFLDVYERLCRDKSPIAFRGSLFWQNREHRRFEQVSLPLSRDGIEIDKIFCVVSFEETARMGSQEIAARQGRQS
jgi:hypothetical protein